MIPSEDALILRKANSMKIFADGDPSFVFGEWRSWEAACLAEDRTIPPAEFKERRRADLNRPKPGSYER